MAEIALSVQSSRVKPLEVSIVVPTYNESTNIREFLRRLELALNATSWEVVFVDDDSPDKTAQLVRSIARADPRVRVLQRLGRRGLSTACIEGMFATAAPIIAVMDADLQHDESILTMMLARLQDESADVAIGTRYAAGGSTGEWGSRRLNMSKLATGASKYVIGLSVTDPMSGFFMLRRDALEAIANGLSGRGFKILLDLLASSPKKLKIIEVPYTFRERISGESKLDSFVIWEYGMLLIDKTVGRYIPAEFISFCVIGGIGVVAHMAVLSLLYKSLAVEFAAAQAIATASAMTLNFSLNNVLTYRDRRLCGMRWWSGLASFALVCAVGAIGNVGVASYLFANNTQWALAAVAGILISAVWNFAATRVYTWGKKS